MKKATPYIIPVVVFFLIVMIQFKPLFSGKAIRQYDIEQYTGMSKELKDFREQTGEEALWTNAAFGGMPAFQISVLYPGNWLGYVDKALHLFMPVQAGYMFMYFVGFYILLLCLRVNPWLALIGSLAFGFSSYFYLIIEVGHNSKANAIGYLAPVLGGIVLLMEKRYWPGILITSLFMALEFNANHLQITYYGFILYLIVFMGYFVHAIKSGSTRSFFYGSFIFLCSVIVAVLPNIPGLYCTYEYGQYSNRGKTELTITPEGTIHSENATSGLDKDYALQYSYGIGESFSFLIPKFKGGGSGDLVGSDKKAMQTVSAPYKEAVANMSAYFGPQDYSAGPAYVGAIVLLLFFAGIFYVKHPLKWPLLIVTALSIMLAWGKYFMSLSALFLDYFPGYNKFRAVSMIDVLAELSIPLLATLSLNRIVGSVKDEGITRKLRNTAIVLIGFCLLSYLLPELVNTFVKENEETQLMAGYKSAGYPESTVEQIVPELLANVASARESIFKADVMRSLILIGAAFLAVYFFLKDKIKQHVLLSIVVLLVGIDMWPVVWRNLNTKSFVSKQTVNVVRKTSADEEILRDKDPDYRVLNLTVNPFSDASTSFYHKSIGGYHGAKLKKYDEVIRFHLFEEINRLNRGIPECYGNDSLMRELFRREPVLNMLNTKYIIYPSRGGELAIKNPVAIGSSWFIKHVIPALNADSEITMLSKINPNDEVIISRKEITINSIKERYTQEGIIKLITCKPNELIYETTCKTPQFAVFSEIYYPKGWNASIDGRSAKYMCVNYLLRGMEIPAGKHKVVFRFEPGSYYITNKIAYVGSGILIVLTLVAGYFIYRKNKSREQSLQL